MMLFSKNCDIGKIGCSILACLLLEYAFYASKKAHICVYSISKIHDLDIIALSCVADTWNSINKTVYLLLKSNPCKHLRCLQIYLNEHRSISSMKENPISIHSLFATHDCHYYGLIIATGPIHHIYPSFGLTMSTQRHTQTHVYQPG